MLPHSVYIHIPFCRHRCAYCDFNTYAGLENLIPDYVEALQKEIQTLTEFADERFPVHTIFFGGGTPSLLPPKAFSQILNVIDAAFNLTADAEISIEANPGTLSQAYLEDLFATGVNRISLGMQSANPQELVFLERQHRFEDVVDSVKWIRQAGFNNLSLDLIFGLPQQPIETWIDSLAQGLNLAPEHFSLYALTLEQGTPMQNWADRGLIPEPDPDVAAEMYDLACDKLAATGYAQYEISNWARENGAARKNLKWACRHNLQYWRNQPYFGFGAGAHGFVDGFRTSTVLAPNAYIKTMLEATDFPNFPRTPATIDTQPIDRQTEMSETMMMGLDLTREGVSRSNFQTRFDQDFKEIFGSQIEKLVSWDLLEWAGVENDLLRLTPRGRLLGNQVFSEFI